MKMKRSMDFVLLAAGLYYATLSFAHSNPIANEDTRAGAHQSSSPANNSLQSFVRLLEDDAKVTPGTTHPSSDLDITDELEYYEVTLNAPSGGGSSLTQTLFSLISSSFEWALSTASQLYEESKWRYQQKRNKESYLKLGYNKSLEAWYSSWNPEE